MEMKLLAIARLFCISLKDLKTEIGNENITV